MARNYEALVQVGFRTKKEVKERIAELASDQDKTISEYLGDIIDSIFGDGNESENADKDKKKEALKKLAQERANRLSNLRKGQ